MKIKILSFILCLLIFIPIQNTLALSNWDEDFESITDLTEWRFINYNSYDDLTTKWTTLSTDSNITDGKLILNSHSGSPGLAGFAWRNSSINYGSWSLDMYLSNKPNNDQLFIILFIIDDHELDYSNKNQIDVLQITKGYALMVHQKADLRLTLMRYEGNSSCSTLDCLNTNLEYQNLGLYATQGMYNLNFTRFENNTFKVLLNEQSVLNFTDKPFSTNSGKFGFISFYDVNTFDNIKAVSYGNGPDTTPPTTSSTSSNGPSTGPSFELLITITATCTIVLMKKRRKM